MKERGQREFYSPLEVWESVEKGWLSKYAGVRLVFIAHLAYLSGTRCRYDIIAQNTLALQYASVLLAVVIHNAAFTHRREENLKHGKL